MPESSSGKRALVTGGTGFVGSRLCERLVNDGWDVHMIVRPVSNIEVLRHPIDRTTPHVHDGSTEGMLSILEKSRPGVVFHLASLFLARHEPKDIEPLFRSNLLFGTQLLEAMAAHGVRRLINTGTAWQNFENREYSPVCLYAATKQAFEAILWYYVEMTPLRAITLKLFDTYGPGDRRPKLFALLRKAAGSGTPLAMSPGEQLLDLVYIDDVVEAFVLASTLPAKGTVHGSETYAVSSGKPVRLKEVVETYSRVTGRAVPVAWGGLPYRPREVMVPWNRGLPLPGWKPRIGLDEGIRRTECHSPE